MITRRKCILGLSLIGIPPISNSNPIKSMLACHSTDNSFGEQQNLNPYIRNGLVAMWDGEWNADWEVHDPDAAIWRDLTGHGNDAVMVDGKFGKNFAYLYGEFNKYLNLASFPNPVPCGLNYTFECALDWLRSSGGGYSGLFAPDKSLRACTLQLYANSALVANGENNGYKFNANSGIWSGSMSCRYISLNDSVWTTAIDNVYFNGIKAARSGTGNYNTNVSKKQGIGMADYMNPDMRLYNLRLYNRPLDADEVAYNCAVDAERFFS